MRAYRIAGVAGESNDLSGGDDSPILYVDIGEVCVECRKAILMFNEYPLSVLAIGYRPMELIASTVPESAARTGVPIDARKSTPLCVPET